MVTEPTFEGQYPGAEQDLRVRDGLRQKFGWDHCKFQEQRPVKVKGLQDPTASRTVRIEAFERAVIIETALYCEKYCLGLHTYDRGLLAARQTTTNLGHFYLECDCCLYSRGSDPPT